jgi:hypothetical protein
MEILLFDADLVDGAYDASNENSSITGALSAHAQIWHP